MRLCEGVQKVYVNDAAFAAIKEGGQARFKMGNMGNMVYKWENTHLENRLSYGKIRVEKNGRHSCFVQDIVKIHQPGKMCGHI